MSKEKNLISKIRMKIYDCRVTDKRLGISAPINLLFKYKEIFGKSAYSLISILEILLTLSFH